MLQLRKVAIACSALYADLVRNNTMGVYFFFLRQEISNHFAYANYWRSGPRGTQSILHLHHPTPLYQFMITRQIDPAFLPIFFIPPADTACHISPGRFLV